MRQSITFIVVVLFGQVRAQQQDTVTAHGNIVVANHGLAPIPAFSLNSPVMSASLSIKKRNFSYDPDVVVGLDGKPWIADNWFRYVLTAERRWKTTVGINPSLFFKSETLNSGDAILQGYRILAFESASVLKLLLWSIRCRYMFIRAVDKGALSGHFAEVTATFNLFRMAKFTADVRPRLVYFNCDGHVDGLIGSMVTKLEHALLPISIYFEGVAPLWSGFEGNTFKWSAGIVYAF